MGFLRLSQTVMASTDVFLALDARTKFDARQQLAVGRLRRAGLSGSGEHNRAREKSDQGQGRTHGCAGGEVWGGRADAGMAA